MDALETEISKYIAEKPNLPLPRNRNENRYIYSSDGTLVENETNNSTELRNNILLSYLRTQPDIFLGIDFCNIPT